MGKNSKKTPKSASTNKSTPSCSCDHPFKCDCGNRPERPSRGHKWDTESQSWTGKGHKQKGGGTIKANPATILTTKGQTTVASWQRLPSVLLKEYCKSQKRPPPKFKLVTSKPNYKSRVILNDAKNPDKDLLFCPKVGCGNEEQAMEECALLGLLNLTPTLPHERKLPEPYRTTWLNAIQAGKNNGGATTNGQKSTTTTTTSNGNSNTKPSSVASASTSLQSSTGYLSISQKKQQSELKRQKRNSKFHKLESHRMANRDHQVFMSATVRKRIEMLLRGDTTNIDMSNDDDDDDDEDMEEMSELRSYVLSRLKHEGFTNKQAKASFSHNKKMQDDDGDNHSEEELDGVYEECLQWLCIHLNEDQLPEGFDPRGRTLDVVVQSGSSSNAASGGKQAQKVMSPEEKAALQFSKMYGVTIDEAMLIIHDNSMDIMAYKKRLWKALCSVSNYDHSTNPANPASEEDLEIARDEMEALEAIFPPEEYSIIKQRGNTIITLSLPNDDDDDDAIVSSAKFEIHLDNVTYPNTHPMVFLQGDKWKRNVGGLVHTKIIHFLKELQLGDPMVYELYGFVTALLSDVNDDDDDKNVSLITALGGKAAPSPPPPTAKQDKPQQTKAPSNSRRRLATATRRPRGKSYFWCTTPQNTVEATPFPKVSMMLQRQRRGLPALKARAQFLKIMDQADKGGRVVLVTGATGCGKTTQIPQFILEEAPLTSKIVVAQPRRLAATGVATRVASERGEDISNTTSNGQSSSHSVGYVVRGDVQMQNDTRLMFCTTGVLLRQLQCSKALDCVTHVVIDEVHERHLDTDILLGVLKECLKSVPHLRVVLMSATMDADRFAAYWGENTPRMHIPGFTHPVEDFTLEDVLDVTGFIPSKKAKKNKKRWNNGGGNYHRKNTSPWADSEKSDNEEEEEDDDQTVSTAASSTSGGERPHHGIETEELLKRINESEINYDLIAILVRHIIQTKQPDDDGSILIFLPGAPEINQTLQTIQKVASTISHKMQLLLLHGGLQAREQNLVFNRAQHNRTKVILSTNVAETSITIPDCTVVIDTCREKQSSYDPNNRMPMLIERFASQDSLKQRRGRAGRVRPGTCYKLISKKTYNKLSEHGEPEIKRCALEQTLLSLLFLGMERGNGEFLNGLLDPPSRASVEAAVFSLKANGAVETVSEGNKDILVLTPLGMHLAGIPAPPSIGKLLVMGSLLGCRNAALAIAAGMSVGRSPFMKVNTFKKTFRKRHDDSGNENEESSEEIKQREIIEERTKLFKTVGNSDHAMLAAVYSKWDGTNAGQGSKKRFCESMGLSFTGMRDMKQLYSQFDGALSSAGFPNYRDESNLNSKSWRIIRTCVMAALAPGQIVRVERASTKYSETVEGAVEKDGEAKALRFFVRVGDKTGAEGDGGSVTNRRYHGVPEERVFIHPSSATFTVGSYSCPWLVYHDLVRTSKPFLRDATECSSYGLLLFGGKIEIQATNGLIVVDDWARLAAAPRIGALIGGLRQKVDDLLREKVLNPSLDIVASVEMKLIVKLLISDGLGQ